MKSAHTVFKKAAYPVRWVVVHVVPHGHDHFSLLLGVVLMFTGSGIASAEILPHLIRDMVGYLIHGLGAAPVIELLIREEE